MYTFVESVVLSKSFGAQWELRDISRYPIFKIINSYSKVYLTLLDSKTNTRVYVDLFLEFKDNYLHNSDSFLALLSSLSEDRVLNTVDSVPNSEVKRVVYCDGVRAGYKIKPIIEGTSYTKENFKDVKLERPDTGTDISLLHNNCLVSINGYYHKTELTNDGEVNILNAGSTLRKNRNSYVGITSFLDIGTLTKFQITEDEITLVDNKIIYTPSNLTIPDLTSSLENKTYFFLIGGYLMFNTRTRILERNDINDPDLVRMENNKFIFDIPIETYLKRLMETRQYLDISSLNIVPPSNNEEAITVNTTWNEETIKKYFSLPNSLLIIVDSPNIITNKIHIRHSSLPGMFISYQNPTVPLIVNDGKVAEYWKTEEDTQWLINVDDSYYKDYILTKDNNPSSVVNNNVLDRPYKHTRSYLLEILGY